jgi:predicted nuclease with TOPRIM domain
MKMSETSETFTERVDVTSQPDGALIGTLEIDVRRGDVQQDRIAALLGENSALRDRVRKLEGENAELRAQHA